MTHHHDHDHDHGRHHHHEIKSDLTFTEKMIKLLDHWVKHNEDHAGTYKDWAERAKAHQLTEIGVLLDDVHALTLQINVKLHQAAGKIH